MKFRKRSEIKFCNKCKTAKTVNLWSKNKSTKDGLSTQCKSCMVENAKRHYSLNKTKVLNRSRIYNKNIGRYKSIEKKYGLNKKKYLQMVIISKNKCAICKNNFKNKEPYIDHCHKTKVIRGLLCNSCNVGLARFKDNCLLLDNAKKYLRRFV